MLANISSTVGQQINSITVVDIQYGSVAIDLLISTKNTQSSPGANTQFINLQNLLIQNEYVATMQISSSTVVINGAQEQSNSTVLIIAIVVPTVVASNFLLI